MEFKEAEAQWVVATLKSNAALQEGTGIRLIQFLQSSEDFVLLSKNQIIQKWIPTTIKYLNGTKVLEKRGVLKNS